MDRVFAEMTFQHGYVHSDPVSLSSDWEGLDPIRHTADYSGPSLCTSAVALPRAGTMMLQAAMMVARSCSSVMPPHVMHGRWKCESWQRKV